jgi:4-hydroxybenzoate polyprenyltransferase
MIQFTHIRCVPLSSPISLPTLPCTPLNTFLQDKHDDARIGIRSTARLFGQHSRAIVSLFSVVMIGLLVYAGMKNDQGAPYYMGVTTAAGQLARIAWSVE